jgi:hypothetical protein
VAIHFVTDTEIDAPLVFSNARAQGKSTRERRVREFG